MARIQVDKLLKKRPRINGRKILTLFPANCLKVRILHICQHHSGTFHLYKNVYLTSFLSSLCTFIETPKCSRLLNSEKKDEIIENYF